MKDSHKPNHKCLACGAAYYACDSCDQKIGNTWRAVCCQEGHYRAYYAMWRYGQHEISRDEVKAVLQEQNALSWENAPGRALIEEIMGEPEKAAAEEPAAEQNEPEPAKAPAKHVNYIGGKKKK